MWLSSKVLHILWMTERWVMKRCILVNRCLYPTVAKSEVRLFIWPRRRNQAQFKLLLDDGSIYTLTTRLSILLNLCPSDEIDHWKQSCGFVPGSWTQLCVPSLGCTRPGNEASTAAQVHPFSCHSLHQEGQGTHLNALSFKVDHICQINVFDLNTAEDWS